MTTTVMAMRPKANTRQAEPYDAGLFGFDYDEARCEGLLRVSLGISFARWGDIRKALNAEGLAIDAIDNFWHTIGDAEFYRLLPKA